VEATALAATKTDGTTYVTAGTGGSTYTITLHNAGPSDADHVIFDDTIPAPFIAGVPGSNLPADCTATIGNAIHCVLASSLAAGATWTITVTYSVPASATPTTVTNTAVFTTDEVPSGTSASDTTNVIRKADLEIVKTGTPTTVSSGDTITYTIIVKNYGPSFSSGFTVSDVLDPNLKLISAPGCTHTGALGDGFGGTVTCIRTSDVAVGASVVYTIVVQTRFPLAPTTITNTATVTGADNDPNSGNNSSSTTTTLELRPATGSSTMTDSAFKIQTDLSPWTIGDFEILVNNQNTIVATNPGQFYYHQRVTSPYLVTTSVDFRIDWPNDFVPQVEGGNPIHAYVRLDGQTSWTDWTPQSTGSCWNQTQNQCSGSDGTITVNNVPAKAEVWVTVHLDLRCKGMSYDCLKNLSLVPPKDPMKVPYTLGPFTSTATIKVSGVPVSASTTSTSLIGRGKKVTMVYGFAKNAAGTELPNTWVQLTHNGKSALVLTEIDGSYLVYDGQLCTGDGLVSCSAGTTWTFANGTGNSTLAILGNGPTAALTAAYPTYPPIPTLYTKFKITSNGATVVPQTTNPPTTTFGIAKGSSYPRDWIFTP